MASAQSRGWGPGWPNCQKQNIVTIVRPDGGKIPVNKGIAELVGLLCDLTEMQHYDIYFPGTWGYACRAIAGTSIPSNHSWGLAVDINAPSNPQKFPLTYNIPPGVIDMWKAHTFRWGGDYKAPTKPDPMHFEFMGTPDDAVRVTQRLKDFLTVPVTPPSTPSNPPTKEQIVALPLLKEGATGQYVRNMQGLLVAHGNTITVDGMFGPNTTKVLRDWQARTGVLEADGICGPSTWSWLTGVS